MNQATLLHHPLSLNPINTLARHMAKYAKLLLLLFVITYTIAPEYASAADIVVKAVRIKKKNPKTNNNDYYKTAFQNFDIKDLSIIITPLEDPKSANTATYAFDYTLSIKNNDAIKSMLLAFNSTDAQGFSKAQALTPTYNEKTQTYQAAITMAATIEAASIAITITNTVGDMVLFEADPKGPSGNDPCNLDFKLKEISFETTTIDGLFAGGFNFSFEKNSDIPAVVGMRVLITNCRGESKIIVVPIKVYNGLYSGGFAMPQDKECPWTLSKGEVYAYNPCGDMTCFASDFDKHLRTSGAGTRSTTTTTQSGRPALQ